MMINEDISLIGDRFSGRLPRMVTYETLCVVDMLCVDLNVWFYEK